MNAIDLNSAEPDRLFEFLVEAARSGKASTFSLDGRPERDLLKVALRLPDTALSENHKQAVAPMFSKPQSGYRRTGANLAHRANMLASSAHRQADLLRRKDPTNV